VRGVLFWGYKRKSPLAFPNAPQSAFLDGFYTITVGDKNLLTAGQWVFPKSRYFGR
jgi:hypothetical protein